jgi:chemotaxis protein methyltransferase CheR
MSAIARDDYLAFCEGLREICGIDLSQYRRPQMERRLRSFFARQGCSVLTDSLDRLRKDRRQLETLLDRVTINVSQLWRHPDQWAKLRQSVLPDLAAKGTLRAWSAGCSYGAEAYTLAAVCADTIGDVALTVIGTDIDVRMVSMARAGLFTEADAREAPRDAMNRWFERVPDGWQAKDELRAVTQFDVADLLRIRRLSASYDLILCRNTVIYFTDKIRDELHARLAHALRPGGYLVVGGTERVTDPRSTKLEPAHPFIYRKS